MNQLREAYEPRRATIAGAFGERHAPPWSNAWDGCLRLVLEQSTDRFRGLAETWTAAKYSPTLRREMLAVADAWERVLEINRAGRERYQTVYE